MKAAVATTLRWPQVHAFRLERHHLNRRAPSQDLARIVSDIGGAQAQLMSAAELQVAVRTQCTVADVRKALWTDRSLVKTWLMRGTLHLARAEDLPLYTAAMSGRIKVAKAWLKFYDMSEPELSKLVHAIGDALDGPPLTREELVAAVGKGRPARIHAALRSGWGGMLKPAARNGRLCFGPNRGQSVTFVSPRAWLREWRDFDRDAALQETARRYLSAYGPATKADFARWWGAWPGMANTAWSGLAGELVQVSVAGRTLDALEVDVETMEQAEIEEHVRLLPLFDPYLLGHASRDHLFERVHAPKISRTAGWISAVVLVDGAVTGTWTHSLVKRNLHVSVTPFAPVRPPMALGIRTRVAELAAALEAGDYDLTIGTLS